MDRIFGMIQSKANSHLKLLNNMEDRGYDLSSVKLSIKAYPCRVLEDGRFFIVTGVKENPSGLFDEDYPDLVFLYNDEFGMYVDSESLIDILKENRENLKIDIDPEYEKMGVWMNIGIMTTYFSDEGFLKLFSRFS